MKVEITDDPVSQDDVTVVICVRLEGRDLRGYPAGSRILTCDECNEQILLAPNSPKTENYLCMECARDDMARYANEEIIVRVSRENAQNMSDEMIEDYIGSSLSGKKN